MRQVEIDGVMCCTVGDDLTDIVLSFQGRAVVRLVVRADCAPTLAALFALAGHAGGKVPFAGEG